MSPCQKIFSEILKSGNKGQKNVVFGNTLHVLLDSPKIG